jgi:class 3 adenylate cyclase
MNWSSWILIGFAVVALAVLGGMLYYRETRKTSIEMDMLLRQMRITNRLRSLAQQQSERIQALEDFHEKVVVPQWEAERERLRRRGEDVSFMEIPEQPPAEIDLARLFADVDESY